MVIIQSLLNHDFFIDLSADKSGSTVIFSDGSSFRVESSWRPGDTIAHVNINETLVSIKVDKIPSGFRVRHNGADLKVLIRNERQFQLSKYMLEKIAADMSKFLLCPMPGMLVSVNVSVGEEVQEGQSLCVVEAMKMENVLRAEKKGIIKSINTEPGMSLAVDETIIEFE